MSLIQEALRRKQFEQAGLPPPPPSPPDREPPFRKPDEPGREPPRRRTERTMLKIVAVFGVMVLLLVVAGGFLLVALRMLGQGAPPPAAAVEPAPAPAASAAETPAQVETEPAPPARAPVVVQAPQPEQPQAAGEQAVAEEETVTDLPSPRQEALATVQAATGAPDGWPPVALTAVMSLGANRSAAMINNDLLNVGDSVSGVVVLEIRENGVMLEYKGEQRFFKIGKTRQ